jgi:hypothetical protein
MRPRSFGSRLVRRSAAFALGLIVFGAWPSLASAQEYFARNLGIYYQLVPYGQSFGARLTRNAVAGSPLGQLEFETGDMIVAMDKQGIARPEDVDGHLAQTELTFVNVRTNGLESRSLWIPNWIALDRLNLATADDLRKGIIKYEEPVMRVQGDVLNWNFDHLVSVPYSPDGPDREGGGSLAEDRTVAGEYAVQALRITLQGQIGFWEPYLRRVERVIADELAYLATTAKPDEDAIGKYERRIKDIYSEAVQEYARRKGLRAEYVPTPRAPARFGVVLTNPSGFSIELTPLTKYRIARAYNREPKYIRYQSGQRASLLGYYMYRIVIDDQRTSTPAWIDVENSDPLVLK